MVIDLYTGTCGSGKSLHAAKDIRYYLNKPRGADKPVIANFMVETAFVKRPQAFTYMSNQDMTPDALMAFADDYWSSGVRPFSEDYIELVIDECAVIFNSRRWSDKGRVGRRDSRMDWLEFMSQHRKYGYHITLISQSSKMIDNQFRMCCDTEVNHRRVSSFGAFGALIGLLPIKLFLWVRYLYQPLLRLVEVPHPEE